MSIEASAWAWQQTTKTPAQRLVLLALADNAAGPNTEEPGKCWPAIKSIAARCQISERSARRHIDELADADLVVKVSRRRRSDGSLSVWEYLIPFQRPPAATGERQGTSGNTDQRPTSATPSGQPASPLAATVGRTVTVSEPSCEPSLNNYSTQQAASGVIDDGFLTWWALYPRKAGKKPAGARWAKMTEHERGLAMDAVHGWIEYAATSPDGDKFVPYASTWLNQERWEDEAPRTNTPTKGKDRQMLERLAHNLDAKRNAAQKGLSA